MAFDVKAALKKPWVKWVLIGVAVIGGIIILRGMSGGSTGTGLSDSQAHDQASLEAQQNAIQAQAASQASAQQHSEAMGQLGLQSQSQQIQGTLDLAKINNAEQTQLAQISLEGIKAQLEAATTQQKNSLDSTVALANITSQTQMHIADTNAGVSNHQISAQKSSSDNGLVAGVIGGAIAAFF